MINDALHKAREIESGIEAIRQRLITAENSGFTDMTVDEIWEEARQTERTVMDVINSTA
ncbi:MAG: hypothetical protein OXI88_03220 [Gammaproteobacteria bacterium]|nr:hypothetical protein [Gammaproteobacteria bacterium]MDE0285337.1 hypothetical protein [Gammaproteobacteria bacterium]MDE0510784.1 hypothetical protein [Gammaproteobacteria bacterium]